MFAAMQKHWVVGLILIGFAVGTLPVFVQAQERAPQPGDYFWSEVSAGTVGALAGGFVAATAAATIVGFLYPCENELFGLSCRLGALGLATVAFLLGAVIGGTYGVAKFASKQHVRGKVYLALIGALGGEALGLIILNTTGYLVIRILKVEKRLILEMTSRGDALLIIPLLAAFTGLGAALGYNVGATVELILLNSKSDQLELVALNIY